MDITKREIIASVTIIVVLIIIGILISTKMSEIGADLNEKYNKAIHIEDPELFKYGMTTSVGDAFVYGELNAVDPVSYPEIEGSFLSIEKTKEVYTKHTREVTHTDSKGKKTTTTETYHTWDSCGTENLQAKKVNFCGSEFNLTQFKLPGESYLDTINVSTDTRYVYYGYPSTTVGTLFTSLANNNIKGDSQFYEDKTISETLDYVITTNTGIILFWIVYFPLIIVVIILFYKSENKWLY